MHDGAPVGRICRLTQGTLERTHGSGVGGDARTDAARRRPTPRRALQWCCYAVPVVIFVATSWAHRFVTEDGFIYLRIAKQIEAGHGPVFNSGQRVEAATGTLWVWLLAGLDAVTPIRLEWIAVVLGIACGVAGIAFAMAGAQRLWRGDAERALFLPFGALAFVMVLPVWIFATSGLETGLSFAWLGLSLWLLAEWARHPHRPLATWRAIALGLGWLVRPELVIFSAGFLLMVIVLDWRRDTLRTRARIVIAMLALPVAYQVFRMGYYGSFVSNTAIAKEGSSTNWTRGWEYFWDFVRPYGVWFGVFVLAVGAYIPLAATLLRERARRCLCVVAVFIAGTVGNVLYVVAVGGDYSHARLLLPAYFALCAPVAVVPAIRQTAAAVLLVPWVLATALVLRPPQWTTSNFIANGTVLAKHYGYVTTNDVGWNADGPNMRWYRGRGYYEQANAIAFVRRDVPLRADVHTPVGAFFGVGVASYAPGVDFDVLDIMGLADPLAAHMQRVPAPPGRVRFAGHEKPLPSPWIAAVLTRPGSRPNPGDFPNFQVPLIPVTTGAKWQEQVAWARAALKCTDISRIRAASDAPLTPRRFVSNFLHSFSNSRVRIAPDPEHAYHQFCGPGTPAEVRALSQP